MNVKQWKKDSVEKLKTNKFYFNDDNFWLGNIIDKLLEKYTLEFEDEIDDKLFIDLNSDLDKLMQGQPIEQILAYTYFYGERIEVFPDVLIPRPDSEIMIETIKEFIPYLNSRCNNSEIKRINILEIGIGSGVLSICLAKLLNELEIEYKILASDISMAAINASVKNVKTHNLKEKIEIELADLWPEKVVNGDFKIDLLFSNPPYIAEAEIDDESIFQFEPKTALIADNNGLKIYNRIFSDAKKYLNHGALLIFEHGYEQKESLIKLAGNNYNYIKTNKDLAARDRISVFNND